MITKRKPVYYCEFCKKKGLSGGHMKHHELHCTNNPNRNCAMCYKKTFRTLTLKQIVEGFKKRFSVIENKEIYSSDNADSHIVTWKDEPITLKEVMISVNNCPICTLAVLRQTKLNHHYFHLDKFDLKEETNKYWKERDNWEQRMEEHSLFEKGCL